MAVPTQKLDFVVEPDAINELMQAHTKVLECAEGDRFSFLDPDATQGPGTLPQLSNATIMLVDDEPTTVEVIQMLLEDAGYREFVTTSESARAMTLMQCHRPDLILMDLKMPNVDGFELLAAVRATRQFARIPVIVLTSSTEARDRLRALELGANDFLAKPVEPSELVLRVRNHLAMKAYQDRIRAERENTNHLLLNILPDPIARRLKNGERTIADYFEEATVLFADLVGFTPFASSTDANSVVAYLNEVFYAFDGLVKERGLEKIKTSGDSYMLAGGLPSPRSDHAEAVVETGLDMLEVINRLGRERSDRCFSIRVGVHTGPLVAGVIGQSKFNYDVWGDTVNVASRMESQGLAGHVQVSASTRKQLGPRFTVERREPIQVKGKGAMQTYLITGRTGVGLI